MTCVFLSLMYTRVFAYTWRPSPQTLFFFYSGCDIFYVISSIKNFFFILCEGIDESSQRKKLHLKYIFSLLTSASKGKINHNVIFFQEGLITIFFIRTFVYISIIFVSRGSLDPSLSVTDFT
jgi:hypothetical protein